MNTTVGDGTRTAAYHQIELFLEHHFVRNTLILQPFEEVEHFMRNVLTKQLRRWSCRGLLRDTAPFHDPA